MIAGTKFAEGAGQLAQMRQGLGITVLMAEKLVLTPSRCGTGGTIAVNDPKKAPSKDTERMIAPTSRGALAAPECFSGSRDFDSNVARFNLPIPPNRALGTARYPKAMPDQLRDSDNALKLSARIRGEGNRVGPGRAKEELGSLEVTIVDLSTIEPEDMAGHLKFGSSSELIALVELILKKSVAIFNEGQTFGILKRGGALIRGATGVVLNPVFKRTCKYQKD